MAIGSRCQSSNTYLELNFEQVKSAEDQNQLIKLGIDAMKKSQDFQ